MKLYTKLVLRILLVFCFFLLSLAALIFARTSMPDSEQFSITSDVVNNMIVLSAILAVIISPFLLVLLALLDWSPQLAKKLTRRMSLETAFNLRSILAFTSVPMAMLAFTFLMLKNSMSDVPASDLYGWVAFVFLGGFAIVSSISLGILNEKQKATLLLCKFSEDVKASIEKTESSFLISRKFARGMKALNGTLPRACRIPSLDRRISQVELILYLGDKKDLIMLSDHVLGISESIETDYLEGFDEKYRNLTRFLDGFENKKKGVVELAEKVSLRERIKKQSGEVVREILVKTIPFLIVILLSILIYMLSGIRIELPT